MAVNLSLSALAKAACAMFREAVSATKTFLLAKGVGAGLKGVQFAGNVGAGNIISTPGGMGGSGPPGKGGGARRA